MQLSASGGPAERLPRSGGDTEVVGPKHGLGKGFCPVLKHSEGGDFPILDETYEDELTIRSV